MKQDRFLLGILIFIGVLVLLALGLFFLRNETPEYGPENTPQGVVSNYVLALERGDYERAYASLAAGESKPSYTVFLSAFRSQQLGDPNTALQVGETEMPTDSEAWVALTLVYPGSGPFDSGWSNTDHATLILQESAWKITYLPYPWWGWDWYTPTPEPVKP